MKSWSNFKREKRTYIQVIRKESSQTTTNRGMPIKTIKETIIKDLEVNELDRNMVFDRTYGVI